MSTPTTPDPSELEQVEEDIEAARRRAEEHGTIPGKHEPTFADPDGDGDVDVDEPDADANVAPG
jgi:hypothetical protein